MRIAILVVSDSRTIDTDTSGTYLEEAVMSSRLVVAEKRIVPDDLYAIRAIVSQWIFDPAINVIICTGGTGFSSRDSTPEALAPLFDKTIDGFGELFRHLSYDDIGTSTIQSRAVAGLANNTLLVALPGSTNACRLAWEKILVEQLNVTHQPCNFAELIHNLTQMK